MYHAHFKGTHRETGFRWGAALAKNGNFLLRNIPFPITEERRAFAAACAAGETAPGFLDEETFGQYLDSAGVPDPDLVIRPSGEQRLSNFLLWQSAYAEFYFTEALWPDFSKDELHRALAAYQSRSRRFGGV